MSKPDITRQPHWLNKSRMATSLGISTQAFDKWGVEPVARIGREAFYDVRSVLENRLDFAERNTNQTVMFRKASTRWQNIS